MLLREHLCCTLYCRYLKDAAGGDKQPHEAPSGKGKRLIILHAGWKGGFLPGCELVFVGNTKSHDYHDEMNAKHFEEWWTQKLLPSIQQHLPAGEPTVPFFFVLFVTYVSFISKLF